MTNTGPSEHQRALVMSRDWDECLRCGRTGAQIHHRRPRMAGGTTDPLINAMPNLVLLCMDCHDWVEMNRHNAREAGYLLRNVGDAPTMPMLLLHKKQGQSRYVRLDFDGTREELDQGDAAYFERYGAIPRKGTDDGRQVDE